MITRKIVAARLLAYMKHNISISELVEWAEKSIMEVALKRALKRQCEIH